MFCFCALLTATVAAVAAVPDPLPDEVDLRPQFEALGIAAKSQGGRGTCSVFALVGALEFELARATGTYEPLSEEFLNWASHKTNGRPDDGTFFSDGVAGVQQYGICLASLLPYAGGFDAALQPSPEVLADAATRRAAYAVWVKDWDVTTGLTDEMMAHIKALLAEGHPVAAGLRWPNRDVWTSDHTLEMPPDGEVFDGHSILLVGYRTVHSAPGGGVFIFRNSAGAGWANEGYACMPFAYAQRYCNDALALTLIPGGEPPRELSASEDVSVGLSRQGEGPGPQLQGETLDLLNAHQGEVNAAAWGTVAQGPRAWTEIRFRMRLTADADGMGLLLLDTARHREGASAPALRDWAEPNLPGAFGVGFDTCNPPTKDIFNADGNIYDRPQREVSLHWDGSEIANVLSPVEYRGDGPHDVRVRLEQTAGGSDATVWIDGLTVVGPRFIPGLAPFAARLAMGGAAARTPARLGITDLTYHAGPPAVPSPEPARFRLVDGEIIHAGNREPVMPVEFPELAGPIGRAVMTLTLEAPPGGYDPWDRGASVYLWDDDGERIEVLRYITPFGRGYRWQADVTDFLPLFRGRRQAGLRIDTWVGGDDPATRKGWKVTVDLDQYPGTPAREAHKLTNVWSGFPEIGDPAHPINDFLVPRSLALEPQTTAAKLRVTVTGHGMHPATGNAAEFLGAWRTVTVNGAGFRNYLWRTDCYLNPCRPQGGTWKFDRTGWAPGSLVEPWQIDVTPFVAGGGPVEITYDPEPYVNEARDKALAWHWMDIQLIEYRTTGARP